MLGQDIQSPPIIQQQVQQVQQTQPRKAAQEIPLINDTTKNMFLSVENSRTPTTNFLALEKSTFEDLKNRNKIKQDMRWQELQNPETYDLVAEAYVQDLMQTFKIPTIEEAALWSYRPGYYAKYDGDIEKIPDEKKGSFGKSAKEVMRQRKKWLDMYLESLKEQ